MFHQRFLTSIVLILLVPFLIFAAPWPLFMSVAILLVAAALREFYGMMDLKGLHPLVFFGIFSGVVLVFIQFISICYPRLDDRLDLSTLTYFLIVLGTLLVVLSRFGRVGVISCISATFLGIFYVPWLFGFLVKVRYFPGGMGHWFLLFVLLVSKVTDIAAYLVGSLIGKHKLVPAVSPKKTIEGAVGGILGAVGAGSLIFLGIKDHLKPFGWGDVLFLSILFGFFSQIGDIIESAFKRDAGVKDSGNVLPGMGGLLDLLDSILITVPLMYFYMVARIL